MLARMMNLLRRFIRRHLIAPEPRDWSALERCCDRERELRRQARWLDLRPERMLHQDLDAMILFQKVDRRGWVAMMRGPCLFVVTSEE